MDSQMRAAALKELTALHLKFLRTVPKKESEAFLHMFITNYYAGWHDKEIAAEVTYARDVDALLGFADDEGDQVKLGGNP